MPYFDGKLAIEEFLDWLQNRENFFNYMDIPEEKRVKLVAYKLRGGVSTWWDELQNNRRREGKSRIRALPKIRSHLKRKFLPIDYEQILYEQYQHCKQRNKSVKEYTKEFNRLNARNNLQGIERQQPARYLGGLKEAIQEQFGVKIVHTLAKAISLVLKVELNSTKSSLQGYFQRKSNAKQFLDKRKVNNKCQSKSRSSGPTCNKTNWKGNK